MDVLILGSLNDSLTTAKVQPLLDSGRVSRIVWVTRHAVTPVPGVMFTVVPEASGAVARSLRYLWTALRLARRERFHVVMAYNVMPFGAFAWLTARLTGAHLAINIIGGYQEIDGGGTNTENRVLSRLRWMGFLLERVNRAMVRRADFLTTTGTRTRHYLEAMGITGERVFVMPSVPDARRFRPAGVAPEYDLVTVASLIPRKRIDAFLDIVASLRQEMPGIRAAIVGDGPLRGELEGRSHALGVCANVDFLGSRDDVHAVFQRSRVFVLTSILEGLPLSLMEAMACGVVPVVSHIDDIDDLVTDRVNGYLIDPRDQAAYVTAIRSILDDEPSRRLLSARAMESIASFYTADLAAKRWQSLFETVSRLET